MTDTPTPPSAAELKAALAAADDSVSSIQAELDAATKTAAHAHAMGLLGGKAPSSPPDIGAIEQRLATAQEARAILAKMHADTKAAEDLDRFTELSERAENITASYQRKVVTILAFCRAARRLSVELTGALPNENLVERDIPNHTSESHKARALAELAGLRSMATSLGYPNGISTSVDPLHDYRDRDMEDEARAILKKALG